MKQEFDVPELETKPRHNAPVWFQLFLAIGLYLLFAFVSGLGDDSGSLAQYKNDKTMISMLKGMQVFLVTLVFIFPVVLFSFVLRHEKIKFLNLNKRPQLLPLLIGLVICIAAMPLVSGTSVWNANMHLPGSMEGIENWMKIKEKTANETIELFFQDKSLSAMFVNLFVVAFMAGLSEEIFFRGFIQRLLIENKINIHIAVWVTAILFSAIHLQFFGFLPRMLLGAVLGYLYAYTNNLWVPILAHTVNNSFAVVMAHITGSISDDPLSDGKENVVGIPLMALSFIVVGGMIFILYRSKVKNNTIESI